MWISQLATYTLDYAPVDEWPDAFEEHALQDPEPHARQSIGFLRHGDAQVFVDTLGEMSAFLMGIAERHLPKDAVDREVKRRLKRAAVNDSLSGDQLEAGQQDGQLPDAPPAVAEPIADAQTALWAEVEQELLATAPIREKTVAAVYDQASRRLYVFGSPKLAEDVILTGLRLATGSVRATPILPQESVQPTLTRWLMEGVSEEAFSLGSMAELASSESEKGKTTFKNQDLSSPTVIQHLEHGDEVLKLALIWRGTHDIEVTAKGELRRIGEVGDKLKPHQAFANWPEIMAVLPVIFDDVLLALGGSTEPESSVPLPSIQGLEADVEVPTHTKVRRVLVVGDGAETQAPWFRESLESLHQLRPFSEILVLDPPNPIVRAVYRWARDAGVPATIFRGEAVDRRNQAFGATPTGLIVFGESDEVTECLALAKHHGVLVRQIPSLKN